MSGRLNSFQKTMLQWSAMHPYNAAHVVKIGGAYDEPRLRRALARTFRERGLTNISIVDGRYNYHGDATEFDVRGLGEENTSPQDAINAEIERQLNLSFDISGCFSPFRFFVAGGQSYFLLGLTYFHVAADAEAIVMLLRDLVAAYEENRAGEPLDLYPESSNRLLLTNPKVVLKKLLAFPRQAAEMRDSHRPRYRAAGDMSNGFRFFSLGAEPLQQIVSTSRAWGVTVNDVLMALLLTSLSPLAGDRLSRKKRCKMSLGCIVNIRGDLPVRKPRPFGLFLGSFTVTHDMPEDVEIRDLAQDVGRQTLAIKRQKLYLGTPLELGLARLALKLVGEDRQKTFYQKNYPLWGGVTNMNLNSLWGRDGEQMPLDYWRGVSTGPATPLVLSVTTTGERMNVGLSYRSTVFSKDDIEGLQSRFVAGVSGLADAGK